MSIPDIYHYVRKNNNFRALQMLRENIHRPNFIEKLDKYNEYGNSLLHMCCRKGFINMLKIMIDGGCNIDKCNKNRKQTPLIIACVKRNINIVKYLISCKCDLDMVDHEGRTALMLSCMLYYDDIVLLLIKAGCDLNTRGYFSRNSALHLAVMRNFNTTVRLLVDYGCDIDIQNSYDETPLMRACKKRYTSLICILVGYGANYNFINDKTKRRFFDAFQNGYRLRRTLKLRRGLFNGLIGYVKFNRKLFNNNDVLSLNRDIKRELGIKKHSKRKSNQFMIIDEEMVSPYPNEPQINIECMRELCDGDRFIAKKN